MVGLRLAALLGLHPHVGLCRPLAALLWCHFPERDTFGCLGAAAADQGAVLAGFARQGQRKNQNNKHMGSFVVLLLQLQMFPLLFRIFLKLNMFSFKKS